MKKFLVVAILLFPVLTLLWWVYLGLHRPANTTHPDGTTNATKIRVEQISTNQPAPSAN